MANNTRKYVKIISDGSIRLSLPDEPVVKVTESVAEALVEELDYLDEDHHRFVRPVDDGVQLQLPSAPALFITRELASVLAQEFDQVMNEIDENTPKPPEFKKGPCLSLVQDTKKKDKK